MAVLICKNIETEGPGSIEDFLIMQKIPYTIVELSKGEIIPKNNDLDTLIIMGGPMSVNEDEKYPFIKEEEELVRDFISKGKRILGVCLGAQIMAKALGSEVYKGSTEEIGWYDIELTTDGLRDPCMRSLAVHPEVKDFWMRFKVFHWHGETFDIPEGAVRLACSGLYSNQAFRYGDKAYAFQFHIEARKEMIYEWFFATGGTRNEPIDIDRLKNNTEKFYNVYQNRAINFYKTFLR